MTATARSLCNGLVLLGLASLGLGACGSSAGTGETGGTMGSGGSGTSSGGMVGTGGSATGGAVGTGGAGTGGIVGTGGSRTGGTVGTGGSSAGGKPGTGGSTATGGAAGGATGSGCGSTTTTSPCSKSGTTCSLDVGGTTRVYYVQLPSTYSSSKPYPVVFQFHPLGGSAEQALTEYRISAGLPDAIYVTPQGLTDASSGNAGWSNPNGADINFTKAMLASVQSTYCVDNARIFSVGFSYGGMMSDAIGCEMGDVFRAIAPMSGALYSDPRCPGTNHAVAMWGSHGLNDTVVPIADGRAARDKILKQNHCGTTTVPNSADASCVDYQGCDAGYPVTWCEFNGTHMPPSFGTSAITAFFKSF
jgi:polyhydroxybutyrate depolymerase